MSVYLAGEKEVGLLLELSHGAGVLLSCKHNNRKSPLM
jgi:hypothetical protein